jgi:hypothetical protein
VRFDDVGVDWWLLLDWDSSNLRFGKGIVSYLTSAVALCVDIMLCSADLVPVFSFGENDVRSPSLLPCHALTPEVIPSL